MEATGGSSGMGMGHTSLSYTMSSRASRASHEGAPPPQTYQYPVHLRKTAIEPYVGLDEAKFYKAAGVLLYRVDSLKGLQVLLGRESRSNLSWTLLVS